MASSSSARRRLSASGSKVITDPGELGPDLLEALIEAALVLGHAGEGSRAGRRRPFALVWAGSAFALGGLVIWFLALMDGLSACPP
jgi:hypothetical protein